MANYIGNDIITIFNTTIGNLRQDIGRIVTVIGKPIERDCPNCKYDPVNKSSTGIYDPESPYPSSLEPLGPINFQAQGMRKCPICAGKGRILISANKNEVLCLISPLTKEDAERTQLGKNYKINYELSCTFDNKSVFETSDKVVIDGTVCEIVAIIPVGIGTLSQLTIYAGGDI